MNITNFFATALRVIAEGIMNLLLGIGRIFYRFLLIAKGNPISSLLLSIALTNDTGKIKEKIGWETLKNGILMKRLETVNKKSIQTSHTLSSVFVHPASENQVIAFPAGFFV